MDRLLLFADDGSDGSTHAWEWISAQSWPGWQVRVLTVQRQGIDHRDPQPPQPWSPASPRKLPAEAEVASLTHMVADGDPREVLSTTPQTYWSSGHVRPLKRRTGSVAERSWTIHRLHCWSLTTTATVEHITLRSMVGIPEQAVRISPPPVGWLPASPCCGCGRGRRESGRGPFPDERCRTAGVPRTSRRSPVIRAR